MVKKCNLLLFIFVALLMMMAACGGSGTQSGTGDDQSDGSKPPAGQQEQQQAQNRDTVNQDNAPAPKELTVDKPVELTVYYMFSGLGYEGFMNEVGERIVKRQPNISFHYLENEQGANLAGLQHLVTTNTNVDLIILTPPAFINLVETGLDAYIDDLVKKHNFDLGSLDEQVLSVLRAAGNEKLPGLPYKTIPLTILYNRDVFDKFGVDYLKDGMTWDEFYDIARLLTRQDGGVIYRGFANHQMGGYTSNNQLSLPLIDTKTNKAAFETDLWKSYLQNIIRFYQVPGLEVGEDSLRGTTGGGAFNMFTKEQTIASLLTYASNYPKKSAGIDMNWDAALYPEFPEAPEVGSMPHMVFLALSSTSKHPDEAFIALTAMTSLEAQLDYARNGVVPVLKDQQQVIEVFGTGTDDLQGRNARALIPKKYAAAVPYSQYAELANGQLVSQIDQVILGTKDLNTALRDAAENVNLKIAELEAASK